VYVVDGELRERSGPRRSFGARTLAHIEALHDSLSAASLLATLPSRVRVVRRDEFWQLCERHPSLARVLAEHLVHDLTSIRRRQEALEQQANLGAYLGMVAHDGVASLSMTTGLFDVVLFDLQDAARAALPLLKLAPEAEFVVARSLEVLDDVDHDSLVLVAPEERGAFIALAGQQVDGCISHLEAAANRILGVRSAVRSSVTMMESILDMVRAQRRTPTAVNVTVQRVLALLEKEFRSRGIRLYVDLEATGVIPGRPGALMRVWLNLLRNAVDAAAGKSEIHVSSVDTATGVQVVVRDNGPGIPEEIKATLFVPFRTTKSRGLGLGLSSADLAVRAHGGSIVCESEPGKTIFTVDLPRASESDDSP
jgi:two-component system, NtrC family, sensor kinase